MLFVMIQNEPHFCLQMISMFIVRTVGCAKDQHQKKTKCSQTPTRFTRSPTLICNLPNLMLWVNSICTSRVLSPFVPIRSQFQASWYPFDAEDTSRLVDKRSNDARPNRMPALYQFQSFVFSMILFSRSVFYLVVFICSSRIS